MPGVPMPGAIGGAVDIPTLYESIFGSAGAGGNTGQLCPNLQTEEVRTNLQLISELPADVKEKLLPPTLVRFCENLEIEYKKYKWGEEAIEFAEILQNAVRIWNLTHHGLDRNDKEPCNRVVFLILSGGKKKALLENLLQDAGNPENVAKTLLKIAAYLSQQTRSKKVWIHGCMCAKRTDKLDPGQCKPKGSKGQGRKCSCKLCCWTCYGVGGSCLLRGNSKQKVFEILGKDPWTEQAHTEQQVPAPPVPNTPDQEESAPQVPDTTGSPQKKRRIASGSSEDLLVTTEKPSDILKPLSPSESEGGFEENFAIGPMETETVESPESLVRAAVAFTSKEPNDVSVTPSSRGSAFR
jgi:hypothetical protein